MFPPGMQLGFGPLAPPGIHGGSSTGVDDGSSYFPSIES
jgi:hypothetical protein